MKYFIVSSFIVWFLIELNVTKKYVKHYEKEKLELEENWRVEYTMSIDTSKVTIIHEKQKHQEADKRKLAKGKCSLRYMVWRDIYQCD